MASYLEVDTETGFITLLTNALNDALAPFGAKLTDMPFTPQKVLQAIGRI